jgi:hypothetical protein
MNTISTVPDMAAVPRSTAVDRWTWLRWAAAILAADVIVHNTAGTLSNDWEGWGVAAVNFAFILVSGLIVVGLTFGLLVRCGLKPSPRGRNRAALAALGAGIASLAAYGLYFTWAPALVAPAALVLARAGFHDAAERGGRGYALAGAALGTVSLALWTAVLTYAWITGHFPFGL